jgi:hypothetical protein
MEDFRVIGRTERVKRLALVPPKSARRSPATRELGATRADVENLLMDGEFPVEYATTKFFSARYLARIVADGRSSAAFVLRFACFASREA